MLLAQAVPVDWLTFGLTLVSSIAGTSVAVGIFLAKTTNRISIVEHDAKERRDREVRTDFVMDSIQKAVLDLNVTMASVKEIISSVKETVENDRQYVHERISEHDKRNEQNTTALMAQVSEQVSEMLRELSESKRETEEFRREIRAEIDKLKNKRPPTRRK